MGAGNVSTIRVTLDVDDKGTVKIRQFRQEVENTGRNGRSAFSGMTTGLSEVHSMLGQVGKAMFSLKGILAGAGIGYFFHEIFDAGRMIESTSKSFDLITGSAAGTRSEFSFLEKASNDLGQNFYDLLEPYKQIMAASRGTNLEGQATRDIFMGIIKASASLGLSAEQTSGALNAISQMISKGNVQAEELRGQLGERLPGAFNIAARAMNMTTAELNKALDNGEVLASDLLPRLAVQLQKEFTGEVSDASRSANELSESWMRLKTSLAESGVLSVISDSMHMISERTDKWIENQQRLQSLGMPNFFDSLKSSTKDLPEHFDSIATSLGWLIEKAAALANMGMTGAKVAGVGAAAMIYGWHPEALPDSMQEDLGYKAKNQPHAFPMPQSYFDDVALRKKHASSPPPAEVIPPRVPLEDISYDKDFFSGFEQQDKALRDMYERLITYSETDKQTELRHAKEKYQELSAMGNEWGWNQERINEDYMGQVNEINDRYFNAAVDANNKYAEDTKDTFNGMADSMKDAFAGWATSYTSTLNDMLWESKLTFDGIAESFGKMITEMLLQSATKDLLGGLMGTDSKGGVGGGWFGGSSSGGDSGTAGWLQTGFSAISSYFSGGRGGAAAGGGADIASGLGSFFGYDNGGILPEDIYGLGKSGNRYKLHAGENVQNAAQQAAAAQAPAPQVTVNPRIINVLDPSIVGDYMSTDAGEQMIMNVVQKNRNSL